MEIFASSIKMISSNELGLLKGLEKAKLFIDNREGKHREGSREGACSEQHWK